MRTLDARSPVLDPRRVAAAQRAVPLAAGAEPGLERLALLARHLLGAAAALVTLLDDRQEHLQVSVGMPPGYGAGLTVPIELSLCVGVVETGQAVVIPDLRADALLQDHLLVRRLGFHSYAGVPLGDGELVLGAFCVLDCSARDWDDDDLRLLAGLAEPVARELHLRGVVEHLTRSRDAEHRLAAEQSALWRVATAVASGRSPHEVVQVAAHEVAALLHARSVAVVRFLPGGPVRVVGQAGPVEHDQQACSHVLAELRSTGAPASGIDEGSTWLAAPVVVAGRLWGALVAAGRPGYEQRHLQATRLAELVGVCVGNAEAHERLVQQSRTDPLTGAANRRAFGERLSEELAKAQRSGSCTALALLDLDRFKPLNDRYGHATGDRVLCELVGRIDTELRSGDVLARLGGDEFAVVLPATDPAAASTVLERVVHAVGSVPLAGVPVTVTVGAAVVEAGAGGSDSIYGAADAALYRAKDQGRGSLVVERLR